MACKMLSLSKNLLFFSRSKLAALLLHASCTKKHDDANQQMEEPRRKSRLMSSLLVGFHQALQMWQRHRLPTHRAKTKNPFQIVNHVQNCTLTERREALQRPLHLRFHTGPGTILVLQTSQDLMGLANLFCCHFFLGPMASKKVLSLSKNLLSCS
jgi:hypothetical protein